MTGYPCAWEKAIELYEQSDSGGVPFGELPESVRDTWKYAAFKALARTVKPLKIGGTYEHAGKQFVVEGYEFGRWGSYHFRKEDGTLSGFVEGSPMHLDSVEVAQ